MLFWTYMFWFWQPLQTDLQFHSLTCKVITLRWKSENPRFLSGIAVRKNTKSFCRGRQTPIKSPRQIFITEQDIFYMSISINVVSFKTILLKLNCLKIGRHIEMEATQKAPNIRSLHRFTWHSYKNTINQSLVRDRLLVCRPSVNKVRI